MPEEAFEGSGLQIPIPPGFRTFEVGGGAGLIEVGTRRSPASMELRLASRPLQLAAPHSRASGSFTARYAIDETDGGSGGTEYVLRAERDVGGRWIVMEARQQSELGTPDFAVAWDVLEHAKVTAAQ